ncbi:MAG: S8 family serine peptidase [Lysobacterales bacterium]
MRSNSVRTHALAAAISLGLFGALPATSVAANARLEATAAATESYIVRFVEPGLLQALRASEAPEALRVSVRPDLRTPLAIDLRQQIEQTQDQHLAAISARLARPATATHRFQVTLSGAAMALTEAEAEALRSLAGVASVRKAGFEHLDTFAGPTFIGAPVVWGNPPAIPGTRGEGMVLGGIDGGTNLDHPSFANDPSCGFSAGNPKHISAVDCSVTDGSGACVGPNPEDVSTGHGVHTASTAAGNRLTAASVPTPPIPAGFTEMSGVAPCAAVRTYKGCQTNTCAGADLLASINNAIADGVDVINYSISGGNSPWQDLDRSFLDAVGAGIVVAASAGNTNATITNPIGAVNHNGPWVMTVAASSHDFNFVVPGDLDTVGPGTPPANTQNIALTKGSGTPVGAPLSGQILRQAGTNPIGCTATGAFDAGVFNNAIALIPRGSCSFEEKINNAQAAGALMAIISNNAAGALTMSTGAASLPAYSITLADGDALRAFMTLSAPTEITVNFAPPLTQGDTLANFSLRGPDALTSITKPDITGPGIDILAAAGAAQNEYTVMSGTSMSSPHLAGSALLVRALQPTWSPSEVVSALMLTAKTSGFKDDAVSAWDPDDVGSGRVRVDLAPLAGFVLDESFTNFLAADPGTGGDPKTLNIASMRNMNCVGSCQWNRTLKAASGDFTSWNVVVNQAPGMNVTVSPTAFSFNTQAPDPDILFVDGLENVPVNGTSHVLTITATPGQTISTPRFVRIDFVETGSRAPTAHMYVAVQGQQ